MHIAVSTVTSHIQQARLKLGARNRTQIGVMVERAGETPGRGTHAYGVISST